jgi:NAD(P)-dependent dehydrogenase (short-subunit alcohol dehydrogenase family)
MKVGRDIRRTGRLLATADEKLAAQVTLRFGHHRSSDLTSRIAAELPLARAYACDVRDLATMERTFECIESDLGSVDVLIYNAGAPPRR